MAFCVRPQAAAVMMQDVRFRVPKGSHYACATFEWRRALADPGLLAHFASAIKCLFGDVEILSWAVLPGTVDEEMCGQRALVAWSEPGANRRR